MTALSPVIRRLVRAAHRQAQITALASDLQPEAEDGLALTAAEQVDDAIAIRLREAVAAEVVSRALELAEVRGRLPMPLGEAMSAVARNEAPSPDPDCPVGGLVPLAQHLGTLVRGPYPPEEAAEHVMRHLALFFTQPAAELARDLEPAL